MVLCDLQSCAQDLSAYKVLKVFCESFYECWRKEGVLRKRVQMEHFFVHIGKQAKNSQNSSTDWRLLKRVLSRITFTDQILMIDILKISKMRIGCCLVMMRNLQKFLGIFKNPKEPKIRFLFLEQMIIVLIYMIYFCMWCRFLVLLTFFVWSWQHHSIRCVKHANVSSNSVSNMKKLRTYVNCVQWKVSHGRWVMKAWRSEKNQFCHFIQNRTNIAEDTWKITFMHLLSINLIFIPSRHLEKKIKIHMKIFRVWFIAETDTKKIENCLKVRKSRFY